MSPSYATVVKKITSFTVLYKLVGVKDTEHKNEISLSNELILTCTTKISLYWEINNVKSTIFMCANIIITT